MLTARVLYPPVILVMLESHNHARSDPCTLGGSLKNAPFPPAFIATHIVWYQLAANVATRLSYVLRTIPIATGGMRTVLTQNKYWSLWVGMRSIGNCMSQYRKYEIMPAVVRPAEAGRWLGSIAKLGQMAVSILTILAMDTRMLQKQTYSWDTCATVSGVNTKPEHSQDTSANNSEVAEPVAMTCSCRYRKRHVQISADCTVEDGWYGIADTSDQSDQDGIGGRKT
jgi:hypothetical protein